MAVTLTPQAEEMLRVALARHPTQSPAQIVENALAESVQREATTRPRGPKPTLAGFHAWLDEFAAYSDRIPSMPGETFSREMIYEDHG